LAPPAIAVNVSALQFKHPDFLTDVSQTIARHDITPHCLVLELTESLIMDNSELAISAMHRLTAMGVRIALDDFGTGYSSLSYLTRFPLDKLKIDRSFILPIGTATGEDGEAIVKSVISMAKALKIRVVAEGVESEDQADFLSRHGCDEMQGYLYARPLSVAAMGALLSAQRGQKG
jgi:EAL domain-containing protein (putative c-di-GMP-specific phosphodiesterase class I)